MAFFDSFAALRGSFPRGVWLRVLISAATALSFGGCGGPPASPPSPGPAQNASAADSLDPPARVGRISHIEGVVSFRPAAADTWALAHVNRPVTTGDRLWVDSVGRAEIQVGSNAVRIGRETELDITHLDGDLVQLSVPQGTLELGIKSLRAGGEFEIDVPNGAITPHENGSYRVDVSPNGDTSYVTVRSGSTRVTAGGLAFEVAQGQRATVAGESAPIYDVTAATPPDSFDEWVSTRDQQLARASQSSRYVPAEISGIDELDSYGTWATAAVCGPVWYPGGLAVGWAPYRNGAWVWIDPWGWSWAADEPWGWAPFHYGRWEFINGAWGWCPGVYPYGAVWAPALVTFIGGPGWGWGPGYWGWFPLGWGEEYVPVYGVGPFYRRWINGPPMRPFVPYRNRGIPGAVTVVPPSAFERADHVPGVAMQVPATAIHDAPIVATPAVVPTRASLAVGIGGDRLGPPPPSALVTRPVQALRPPPPRSLPFSVERSALATSPGRPLPEAEVQRLHSAVSAELPARRVFHPATVPPASGAVLHSARSGLTSIPALTAPRVPPGASRSTLDEDYAREHQEMTARHMTEYARPQQTESEQAMAQRQEAERRELETRYNSARVSGMTHMPAPSGGGGGGGGHHR